MPELAERTVIDQIVDDLADSLTPEVARWMDS